MSDTDPYATPQAELSVDESAGLTLAPRGARILGASLDAIIGGVIAVALYSAAGYWDQILANQVSFLELLGFTVLGLASFFLVHGYALAHRGQTLGKMAAGTQIVDFQSEELLPLSRLLAQRYVPVAVVTMIPIVGNILAIVNVLFIFRRDRRCVHDHIARTKVVIYQKR